MRWRLPNGPPPEDAVNQPAPERPHSERVQQAWECADKGELTEAIKTYGSLISAEDPAVSSEAAYFLGMLYLEHDDDDQALEALGEAYRLGHPVYSPNAGAENR